MRTECGGLKLWRGRPSRAFRPGRATLFSQPGLPGGCTCEITPPGITPAPGAPTVPTGELSQINASGQRAEATWAELMTGGTSVFKIAIVVWIMLGTALAGIALLTVLAVPDFSAQAMHNIPLAVLTGFALAMPLSYLVALKIGGSPAR